MRIIRLISEYHQWRSGLDPRDSIGFVPTMGALHQGHLSLIDRCRAENAKCVVSIFVNPTQFNEQADLDNYPKTLPADTEACRQLGVDVIFAPSYENLYPDNYHYRVNEDDVSRFLCGAHRPGHFDGVLTVVMKLFNIVRPQRAYFGEKDFQQYQLVRQMVGAFFMPVTVIGCATVRESDGLAMSSRNRRLKPHERVKAAAFPAILSSASSPQVIASNLAVNGFEVDYVEDFKGRRCAAVRLGEVRLIDNIPLQGGEQK
jgi:pantoate--beta-alanine ligase